MMVVRNPVFAGHFYPEDRKALLETIMSMAKGAPSKDDVIGVVSPHAGYMYSGMVAGAVLSSINPKSRYVILGPNHTGMGVPFSLSKADAWRTPLGEVAIDKDMSSGLLRRRGLVEADDEAHAGEHSIEVQLPILQAAQKGFTLLPIAVLSDDLSSCRAAGGDIAGVIKDLGIEKDTAIIASSDMTHYESDESVRAKDKAAIEAMLELDEEKLLKRIRQMDISMCGYGPVIVMLTAAKALGAKKAKLVKYQTSGDASGDYSAVVGYAGITVS